MTSPLPVGPADPAPEAPGAPGIPGPAPTTAAPVPLPVPGWGVAEAVRAWRTALPELPADVLRGLTSGEDPEPVSALTTVVLRAGRWAVKVYPPGTEAAHVEQVRVGLAGTRTALVPCVAPVVTADGLVTVAPWVGSGAPVGWAEVGALLRRFHDDHAGAPLPPWRPLSRVASQAAALPPEAAELLGHARDVLLDAVAATWSELGWGAVHGDVSPSNVLLDDGVPRLIDLDWAAVAPRELDLAPVARRLRSGEVDRATYAAFCRAYGHDVRRWAGLEVLDRVADLGGLVFRVWDCRHHGRDLDWLVAELRRWRTPL